MTILGGQQFTTASFEFCKVVADDICFESEESIVICETSTGLWVGPIRNMRGREIYRVEP